MNLINSNFLFYIITLYVIIEKNREEDIFVIRKERKGIGYEKNNKKQNFYLHLLYPTWSYSHLPSS